MNKIGTGWEGLRGGGGWKAEHEPEVFLLPGSQPHTYQKSGQRVEGSDSPPLLHSGEIPPRAVCPVMRPLTQGRHGPFGGRSDECYKNDQRAEAPLLWG